MTGQPEAALVRYEIPAGADPAAKPAPVVLAGVRVGQQFDQLEVTRVGGRAGQTPSRPHGWPGVTCKCSCGRTGIRVPLYRLLNGITTSCGHARCTLPQGRNPDRDRIAGYLAEHGAARPGALAAALGMTGGAASGQLALMLADGEVERPFRGVYCLPGRAPAEPPPHPPGRSAGNSKSGRTRWANMTAEQRRAVAGRLAAGRTAAAVERAGGAEPAGPG